MDGAAHDQDSAWVPRILFAYRYFGLGGVETAILTKARALRAAGADVHVWFTEAYGQGSDSIAAEPGVVAGLSRAEIRDRLQAHFDLIVIVDYPQLIPIVEIAKPGTRVVYETHCSLPLTIPDFFPRLLHSRLSTIVVPSPFNRRLMESGGLAGKAFAVVPNPIDTTVFRKVEAGAATAARRASGDRFVLWVGRLEDEKNPAEALAVAAQLFRRDARWRLIVVGDTPDYDDYRRMLDARIEDLDRPRVEFLRGIPNARMPELYSLAAASGGCLLSTSQHESQPMIFLEAMACECPVVATSVDGVPDLIQDGVNGRLYALGRVEEAATAIVRLAEPAHAAERRAIVDAGLASITARHRLVDIPDRYLSLARTVTPIPDAPRPRPLVSGVTIFYNGENFLAQAIESVLAQTYDRWELLLVDDGSTDGSPAIAREYARRYPDKIKYLQHEGGRNRGKSASRNLGLRTATGDYVALLDHDDVWLPDKLEDEVALLEAHPEAGMVYGRVHYWHSWTGRPDDRDRDGFTQLGVDPDSLIPSPDLLTLLLRDERTLASPCSVLLRRDVGQRVGFFEESFSRKLEIYDDVMFFSKIYLEAPVYVASDCWAKYRQHPENSTSVAFRSGQWHPRRPNPVREELLMWLEQYVTTRHVTDPALLTTLHEQLRPYREPDRRTTRQRYYDASVDAALVMLRGESPDALLDKLTAPDPQLDAQAVAEQMLDAVPSSTWNAPSLWLGVWPAARPAFAAFLTALEARAEAPALATRVLSILEHLIHGTWLLRSADGNEATLRFVAGGHDGVRVSIATAADGPRWDIQLNSPWHKVAAGERIRIRCRARADAVRTAGLGFAQSHAPWNNLGLYSEIELTGDWRTIDTELVVTADDDNARVHFDLGGSAVAVEVAELTLTRV